MTVTDDMSQSQRAAAGATMVREEMLIRGGTVRKLAAKYSKVVGSSKSYIVDAYKVKMADPKLFAIIEAGDMTVWKAEKLVTGTYMPPSRNVPRATRAEEIRRLADSGHTSQQISAEIGITDERVRDIAREFDIGLPDTRSQRRIDARRVIENTVTGLEGYSLGVQTINGADINMDAVEARDMAQSIRESLNQIKRLCRKLEEISNAAS